MKLSHSVSGAVRQFSYWLANGMVGYPLLNGIDYIAEPTFEGSEEVELY